MKKFSFLIVLFAFGLFSCSTAENPLEKLNWLEGTWRAEVDGNDVMETWHFNDSIWLGESAFVKNGATLFTEKMSIRYQNDLLYLFTEISDQNDGKEIGFKEVEWTDNQIVFENKTHDFPQKITYQLKSESELYAFISGSLNGKEQRIEFNYKKAK